jgi:Fe-S cluster assembly iron-binding protein IscA
MLTVTENAQKQIALFFEENASKPIRVFLSNGCGAPQIAMALDEARPDDRSFEFAGVQYLVDSAFLSQAQPIEIDFAANGFAISSSLELGSGCAGCGSSGQCCS